MDSQQQLREERKRKLLKPPDIKPVLTVMMMLGMALHTNYQPDYNWIQGKALSQLKISQYVDKGDWVNYIIQMVTASTTNISIWVMLLNLLFLWLFGSTTEKRLVTWRYPVFVSMALTVPWILLSMDPSVDPTVMFAGPNAMLMFMLGAYLVFKPKKPFKPQDWKPLPWKIFKGDLDARAGQQVKVGWVSPWTYVFMFVLYTVVLQAMFLISRQDLYELTHQDWLRQIHAYFTGNILPGRLWFVSPIVGIGCLIGGTIAGYILVSIVTTGKVKRAASDLQVQAVLQYKELRALDMNHNQAVEGTSRLIGVPLDVAREWISKGMQPIKDPDEQQHL